MIQFSARALLQRLLPALLLACAAAGAFAQGGAPAGRADVYIFWGMGCPHCERALAFLDRLEGEHPAVRVHRLEVTRERLNMEVMLQIAESARVPDPGVPLIVIGNQVTSGYYDDATTGAALRSAALACVASSCPDRVSPMLGITGAGGGSGTAQAAPGLPATIRVPIVGEIPRAGLSLPVLTVVLGAADGFNPCAMWVLVFLIGLLVGMPDRLRRWTLGTAFVGASALVYYLIMAAWLNMLLFLGMVIWIRAAIGLVALGAGFWALREFVLNREPVCEVTSPERRRRVLDRLRSLALEPRFAVALVGIVLLAFAVNVVELLCSAGIPAVYTQVLALNALERWEHHAYLALYILVFMLDDLIVFFTAMATLEVTGVTGRYVRWSHLVGGAVLVAIGALLLLRPEWLMFG